MTFFTPFLPHTAEALPVQFFIISLVRANAPQTRRPTKSTIASCTATPTTAATIVELDAVMRAGATPHRYVSIKVKVDSLSELRPGGFGSTRWRHHVKKQTVDDSLG